jgi:hypothetical protein
MQDRFIDDPEFFNNDDFSDGDELAALIEENYSKMQKKFKAPPSARSANRGFEKN